MHSRSNRNQAHKNTQARNYPGNPREGKTNKEGLQRKKIITAANSEISYNPTNLAFMALLCWHCFFGPVFSAKLFWPCKIAFPPAANFPSSSAKSPSSALSSMCVYVDLSIN
jgi:hypothetical protein